MRRSRTGLTALQAALLVVVLVALGYVNRTITTDLDTGEDFAIGWTAADLWLRQRISPYDDRVAEASQQRIFGRTSPSDVIRQPASFLMPLPAILFYAPFASFPFPIARTAWMTFGELCLLASAILSFRLVRWRGVAWLTGLILMFAILWYHGAKAVISGQFAPVEGLLLTGSLLAIHRKLDSVAGLLLGLSSVMPQLSILFISFAIVWGLSARRWGLVLWTCGSVVALYGLSFALIPGWPLHWIGQLLTFFRTTDARPIVFAAVDLIPGASAWVAIGLLVLSLIYLVWEWVATSNQADRRFLWTSALTLSFTTVLTYRTTTGVFVILLPGLILALTVWLERWGNQAGRWIGLQLMILAGGLWWLFFRTTLGSQESLLMFLPAPVLALVELWWIRWWASRTTRLPF